jgi:hypothetical protein
MQSRRTCLLSAFTLSTAIVFGAVAMAADLPKEGTFSATYSAVGTAKTTQIGKERVLIALDETGLSVGRGLFDHITWHCSGIENVTSGMGEYHGYCVATDPTGDQFVVNFNDGVKQAWPAKTYDYSGTLTTGSGKYAGISGTIKGECHAGDFRPVSAETYLDYCAPEGSYKLP